MSDPNRRIYNDHWRKWQERFSSRRAALFNQQRLLNAARTPEPKPEPEKVEAEDDLEILSDEDEDIDTSA